MRSGTEDQRLPRSHAAMRPQAHVASSVSSVGDVQRTLLYFTFFTDWARNPYSMRPDLGLLADPIADLYSSKPHDRLLDHRIRHTNLHRPV